MKTRKQFVIASVLMICSFLTGIEAKAQAYSSGGGDSTDYKSTIGYNNNAKEKYTLAAGNENTAVGESSIALGYRNAANGNYSFAAGWGNQAIGQTSFALGYYSKTTGLNSLALGMYASSQADYGITIGRGLSSTKPLSNTTSGIMLGMYSNVPTLYISPSSGENRTGKVGIGNVTDPQAKLHIKGDAIENADIFLASTGSNKSAIRFRNDDNNITVKSDNVLRINALKTYLMIDAPKVCFGTTSTFLSNTNNEVFSIKAPNEIAQVAKTINLTADRDIQMSGDGEIGLRSESISLTGKVGINTANTTPDYALAVDGGVITTKVFIQDVENWPDYVFGDTYKLMPLHELKKFIADNKHLPDMPSESEVEQNGYDMGEMQCAMLRKIEELTLYTLQQQEEIEALRRMVDELKGK